MVIICIFVVLILFFWRGAFKVKIYLWFVVSLLSFFFRTRNLSWGTLVVAGCAGRPRHGLDEPVVAETRRLFSNKWFHGCYYCLFCLFSTRNPLHGEHLGHKMSWWWPRPDCFLVIIDSMDIIIVCFVWTRNPLCGGTFGTLDGLNWT